MKIMTFNTQHCFNYIERKIDFDVMAEAILKTDADIVGSILTRRKMLSAP